MLWIIQYDKNYWWRVVISIFTLCTRRCLSIQRLVATIVFSTSGAASLAIQAVALGAGLLGVLAGDRVLSDIANLRYDMDDDTKATN